MALTFRLCELLLGWDCLFLFVFAFDANDSCTLSHKTLIILPVLSSSLLLIVFSG